MSSFEMSVGNAEIVALTDMNCAFPTPLPELWPNVPYDAWEPFREMFPDTFEGERMRIEIGCYLVRSQGKTILIDTGYGPGPIDYIGGLRGELMAELASKSVDLADVDTVFLSHLHIDHVGWNTREENGKRVPAFPNARYVVHQDDIDHFSRPDVQAAGRYPFYDELVQPLADLDVLDGLTSDANLTDEVTIDDDEPFMLHPGEFVLGSTLERLTLPNDVVARIEGKSSLGRLGLMIHSTAGFIDPGWSGNLTLELANVSRLPITLYSGMRIGQISFQELTTEVDRPYGSKELSSRYQGQESPTASRAHLDFDSHIKRS